MAVPTTAASTMWSWRPTCAGQSRSRTRRSMSAITTPSAPSRLTSPSSWCLASRRDSVTSSVQPATSVLPDRQRVWRAVGWSSCRDPIESPRTSPAGTQPVMISLAKSCPDKSEVKGTPGPSGPGARTAVPMATNSAPPTRGKDPLDSRTPTTPCPPSSPHSAVIRSTAVCRPGPWPARAARKTRGRRAPKPGSQTGSAPRCLAASCRGSCTRCTRQRRPPRRTPGRPAGSPRCGWRRTHLSSARTPTCRSTGFAPAGPRLRQAVPRARPQPRSGPRARTDWRPRWALGLRGSRHPCSFGKNLIILNGRWCERQGAR